MWSRRVSTSDSEAISHVFALIIGINNYASSKINNLDGALSDAQAVQNFLMEDLEVPASQITFLGDAAATRQNILQAFQGLASNPKIQNGDTIIIYYAGHGAESDAPDGWHAGGVKVQMIVPHDSFEQRDGATVQAIPDRTMATLLQKIAKEKGDNIVSRDRRAEIHGLTDARP